MESHQSLKTALALMQQESNLTDVILVCKDREITAHKLILSLTSTYFHSIFTFNNEDRGKERVQLKEISGDSMDAILEYLYTGQIDTIQDINHDLNLLCELLSATHMLKIDYLFCYCLSLIADELTNTNLRELLNLGLSYKDKHGCLSIISSHIVHKLCHLKQRDDFLSLTANELKMVLECCKLNKAAMEKIARAILCWVEFDKRREGDLQSLLELVDLRYIPVLFLSMLTEENNVFRQDSDILTVLNKEALNKSACPERFKSFSAEVLLCFSNEFGNGIVRGYHVDSDKWSPSKELPFFLLDRTAAVLYHCHIYFLGGCTKETRKKILNPFKTTGSTLIYNYCIATNKLVKTDNLCFPVCSASAAVLNKWIYIVGGWDKITDEMSGRRVQRYDPVSGYCEELSPTNEEYVSPHITTFRKRLYVASENPGTVECYDPCSGQWTVIAQIIGSKGDTNSTIAFGDGKLFALSKKSNKLQLHVYDIASNSWIYKRFQQGPVTVPKMWCVNEKGKTVILTEVGRCKLQSYDIESSRWNKMHYTSYSFSEYWTTVVIPNIALEEAGTSATIPHSLLPALHSFLDEAIMTDVVLVCGEKKFRAHSLILCAASPYFSSMLTFDWKEKINGRVEMPTVSSEVMQIIISFIYKDLRPNQKMNWRLQVEVLATSHLMQLPDLFECCLENLVTQMSLNNYIELKDLAELYDHEQLMSRIVTFLVRNIRQFMNTHDFLQTNKHTLKRILLHPELDLTSVENIVTGILAWVDAAPQIRGSHLYELMELININSLSSEYLSSIIETSPITHNAGTKFRFNAAIVAKSKKSKRSLFSSQNRKDALLHLSFRDVKTTPNGQKLLCFGKDYETNVLNTYDVDSNYWLPTKEVPFPLSKKMAVVAYGKLVYFLGGEDNDKATGLIYKYCPSTNDFLLSNSLLYAVKEAACVVLDDAIFIISGKNKENQWSRTVQRYIPNTGSCVTVASCIRTINKQAQVFTYNDLLYVLGPGQMNRKPSEHATPCTEIIFDSYNPMSDQWTTVAHTPATFQRLQLCVVANGILYLVNDVWEHDIAVSAYHFSANEWSSTTINVKISSSVTGLWSATKNRDQVLLVADGNKLHTYNIVTKTWAYNIGCNKNPWSENMSVVLTSPL